MTQRHTRPIYSVPPQSRGDCHSRSRVATSQWEDCLRSFSDSSLKSSWPGPSGKRSSTHPLNTRGCEYSFGLYSWWTPLRLLLESSSCTFVTIHRQFGQVSHRVGWTHLPRKLYIVLIQIAFWPVWCAWYWAPYCCPMILYHIVCASISNAESSWEFTVDLLIWAVPDPFGMLVHCTRSAPWWGLLQSALVTVGSMFWRCWTMLIEKM